MTGTTRLAAAAAATLLGLSALTACGGSSDASSSSTASSSKTSSSSMSSMSMSPSSKASSKAASSAGTGTTKAAELMIMDYKFSGTTKVAPGTRITVVNHDSEAHTVTADQDGAFDVKVSPGQSATLTAPSKPGTYAYHCTYHSNMHGTLTVR